MTALGSALRNAGFNPLENEFDVFLTKWIGQGRTLARLIELARDRYELTGGGRYARGGGAAQDRDAATSQTPLSGEANDAVRPEAAAVCLPSARQLLDGEAGQGIRAPQGHARLASPPSSPRARGEDHKASGQSAHSALVPREPSPQQVASRWKAKEIAARSIWDRSIGGELKLRSSTKLDWINLARKFGIGQHIAMRMVTEVAWPDDDKTPLEKFASEKQVRDILDSGPVAIRTLELGHG